MTLTFDEYQKFCRTTAVYPPVYLHRAVVTQNQIDEDVSRKLGFVYPMLGLAGECGEVAEKLKKVIRDYNGIITDEYLEKITKELGDILWYVSSVSSELHISLSRVIDLNVEKLSSRKDRDAVHGSGDDR